MTTTVLIVPPPPTVNHQLVAGRRAQSSGLLGAANQHISLWLAL